MSENTRKLLSLLMAAAMLFSMLPMGVTAQAQSVEKTPTVETAKPETQPEPEALAPVTGIVPETTVNSQEGAMTLALGENMVTITEAGGYVDCTFVPTQTGIYNFYSVSERDTYAYLFDAEGNQLTYNDDGGNGNNFVITWELTAGSTYTLRVKFYGNSNTGGIKVIAEQSPFVSVSLSPVSVIEGTCGYYSRRWDGAAEAYVEEYYYYENDIMNRSTIAVTCADGTVVTGQNGYVEYNGQRYSVSNVRAVEEDSQDHNRPWSAGNSYTLSASLLGMTQEFEVTIVPTPLQSITIQPIDVIENTCGRTTNGWDSESQSYLEYYYYEGGQMLTKCSYTATFTDGTVVEGTGNSLEYNGNIYGIGSRAEQSYETRWSVGNSYTFDAYVMGCITQVTVNITEVPLQSITFTPIEIMEGTFGGYNGEWDEETQTDKKYFQYYAWDIMQKVTYTATFTDGTVITGTGLYLDYEGERYQFDYAADAQTYENPWTAGNTYCINVSAFGQSYQVPVTITESPLESFVFTPVEIMENTNGSWYQHWNPETQTEEQYYYYHYQSALWRSGFTATFADGTTVTGNGTSLEYNGQWYNLQFYEEQNYENQWTTGNTYYVDVYVLGYRAQLPVTIAPCPWESITFAPVTVVEGTYGSWSHGWDSETQTYSNDYYYYEHSQILSLSEYTIQLTDGTTLTGTGSSFTCQDETYYFETGCTQNWDNPWLAGGTYNLSARVQGWEAQIPVTIVSSGLESITINPVEIIENSNGYTDHGWDSESQTQKEYYRYSIWDIMRNTTYTATFADGTVITGSENILSYNGKEYDIFYYDIQDYQHQWTVGNTYYIKVYTLGRETVLPVSIVPTPLESITFTPVEIVEHTNGGWYGYWNPETQSTENYFEYRPWIVLEKSTYTATFRDGTVLTGMASDGFTYNGQFYGISYSDPQNHENQWTVGNTYYLDVSVLGQTAQIPVTITTLPIESLTFTPVTVMEKTNGDLREEEGAEYFYYYPHNILRNSEYKLVLADGTELTGRGEGFHYDGQYYTFSCNHDQSAATPWLPGNTYNIEITVGGYTAQLSVTIEASPLQSITFEPIAVIEGTCGGIVNGWNSETQTDMPYFLYQVWDMLEKTQFTATFTDGTTQTGRGNSSLQWEDRYYGFSSSTNQEWDNPWTVGNTYYINVSIMGLSVDVPVTIIPSPVVSLTVEPVTMTENRGGSMNSYWPGDGKEHTYYVYHWANRLNYTVTLNDGSVFTVTNGGGFYYEDEWYYANTNDNQGWENQWTVGNTYTATVSVMGYSVPVCVEIVPAIKQVIALGENEATIEYPGDELDMLFTPEESGQYTFLSKTNGYEDTYAELYDANGRRLTYNDDGGSNGNFKISWNLTAGETYTLRVRYYSSNKTGTIPVYVKAYPVASIAFDPVIMEEHAGGDWYGENYYQYYWQRNITYTITFKDGTVKQGTFYNSVEYDGAYYGVDSISDEQNGVNPWLAGNTYAARAEFGGKWYDVYVSICRKTEDNGFTYFIQDGKAIINGCTMKPEILQIPETIEGCPVVGITSLGEAVKYATEIRIPDSVTMMSADILTVNGDYYGPILPLKKLTVGTGVASLSQRMLDRARNLEYIEIATDNPYLCSIDGVVYNKALTALVVYPPAKTDLHVMPDSVTDVSVLFAGDSEMFMNLNVQFGAGVKDYKMVDGIIYNPEMTTVIKATATATGSYVMPESVTNIASGAFFGSNLTAVSVSPNVTNIVYTMFYGHSRLEEITIPVGIRSIDMWGDLDSLQKIHITDLEYWCNGIWFGSNPLQFAHDLYLNGEKIVDMVLPETVADGVYTNNKINRYAFTGASFESVTIPSRIADIGFDAFADCENLQKVYISDLGAWSGTLFANPRANPLYYAHDLYLNGEKIVDLVLPETVADRIYGQYYGETIGVNRYAFYNASFETATVPEKIQVIGDCAFEGCENLTKVYISDLAAWCRIEFESSSSNPLYYARDLYLNGEKITDLVLPNLVTDSVYVTDLAYGVGNYTFYNVNIESLTVPSHVQKIGDEAFYGSTVEQITFEEGIDTIGYNAFEGSNVKALDLPDSLVCIRSCAFLGCSDLETVNFGNGLLTIYYAAFAATGVKSIELPDSLYYLGGEVFAECQNLTHVDFGNGINGISYSCFRNTGLKTVTLPKQIEIVDSGAFENSQLTEVIFDCDKVEIYESAFANCPLGDLELGDNITMVGAEAFAGTNATQIKLPASVTEISYRVYAFNENLVSVTIPDTITYINSSAFEGDNNLSHVLYTGTMDQWCEMNVYSTELLRATLHCEAVGNEVTTTQTCTTVTYHCSICDKTETVRKGNATHTFDENQVCTVCGYEGYWEYEVNKDGTVTITGYTGPDTEVVVPEEIEGLPVTAFTKELFAYNREMILVELPAGITEIPAEAFYGCSALRNVFMGDKVTVIGEEAFSGCNRLRNFELPDSVTTIGAEAFKGVTLENFKLPKSMTTIGEMAFAGCYLRTDCLEIPAGVTEIAYSAFVNCWNVRELILPDTVTTIGYYAFAGAGITELTIPASVKDIGAYAFDNNNIKTLVFLGDQPFMYDAFDKSGITAFYTGANKTWNNLPEDRNNWYACNVPVITQQPVSQPVASGETVTLSAGAYGHRLSYQWYYAAPGAKKFTPVGGDSIELTMTVDQNTAKGRVYCLVTDILGQTARTNTVTLRNPANTTGIRLSQLPYTREYDMRQELRTRGLEVMLTFDDGSEELVTDYIVTGHDANVGGVQTITVTYGDYTATFTVTVNEEKLNFTNTQERIEISAPEGAVESNVELVVEKVYDETQLPELPEVPEIIQENNAVIFDITLEKEGEAVQPEKTVQVSIPVPEHMESKRCKVYHIGDDGTATDMNAQYKDGRMVFDTDHFSYYAVVEVSGVTVSGTLTGASDFAGAVVKLLSGGEVLETVSVSKNGTYRFDNVIANDYEIEAVQDGLPTKKIAMTVAEQDMILDILMAILGDIDGNEQITRDDVIRLLLHVTMPGRFPLDAEADFNGDNQVTRDDVIRLLLHVTMPNRFPLG